MTKTNLEAKTKNAIFDMSKKVNRIYNAVGDIDLKLSHIIEQNKMFYARTEEYNAMSDYMT